MGKATAVTLLLLLSCIGGTFGQSCEVKCGQMSDSCSCHPTCTSLGSCCADYKEFCVETFPHSGSILGGVDLLVLNAKFDKGSPLVCRFNGDTDTVGYVDDSGRGHCIAPLLYQTGWVSLHVSSDNGTAFSRAGAWLSVHTGKLDAKFKATLVNSTKWQYYGTPQVGGSLEMAWNTSLVRADRVNIELWGYIERGKPYSEEWLAEWKYLYSIAKDQPNNGAFSFVPQPALHFSSWELGAVRVSSSVHSDGIWNVQAAWTEDHALAWHLEEKFREDSQAWALEKCLAWDQLEITLPNFLNEIIDCPCTLAQARADTGRFHTDYGCDIEKGSVCTYHPGSVHCVRAIQASPKYAAGQQCCYDSSGAQVLTADSIGGSTPDRAHDWGSPPYRKPPRVPGQSHWVYDVLSFYYCCLWSDNCHYYFKHRPSSDCRRYQPPNSGIYFFIIHSLCQINTNHEMRLVAVVFGDPHFITFDGVRYSFNGKGEYRLLTSAGKGLAVQGRTEPVNGTAVNATKLSSVAMKEASSDVIEVRLLPGHSRLQVLQNQKSILFNEQSWMDLNGVFVFSPVATNVTVMFPSGAGVEVRLREGTLAVSVLLPEEFRNSTEGLLGNMNGDATDDLVVDIGQQLADYSDPQEVFDFGASWAVSNTSALFTYDSKYLLDTYYHSPRHDNHFVPVFVVHENPDDPLYNMASDICSGDGSQFCRYDILVGRDPKMGKASKISFLSHISLVEDLKPVISCGWLAPPPNGRKEGTTYLQGAKVRLSCDDGYTLEGSSERTCQGDGRWSGGDTSCTPSSNIAGIVAGSVIGALTLIIIITTLVLHSRKKKRRPSIDTCTNADL
ncbi:sushi domain-containing protein 2-like isoform X1 [Entelurus aequoreus]|uniref:sushi domain-containing protein 2-like isoform X1 n=1 Tax=Entelurus aequoreus TaxID=161455 RepID=UPI002B1DF5D0|nr:sushi domain-containing protein 2-like isoform X1 [Entelurus aequoreus]